MATADIFKVLLQADASGVKKGSAEAASALKSLDGTVNRVKSSLGSIVGKIGMFGAGLAGLAGIGGFGSLVIGAAKSAAEFDVLTRSLQTVTGSAEEARKIMKFAEDLAGPSAFFDTEQLARAGTLMATFGLEVQRFLPIASTMASLIGQNEESLNAFAGALGRIKAGQFGEGFEALRRYGLGRQALEEFGGRFNNQGQFAGTADEALAVIERAVKTRFGELDRIMQDSPMAKFTSLADAWAKALRKLGAGILEAVTPAIKSLGDAFNALANSGAIEKIGKKIADLFKGIDAKAFAVNIVAGVQTAIEVAVRFAGKFKGSLGAAIGFVENAIKAVIAGLSILVAVKTIAAINVLVAAFVKLRQALAGAAALSVVIQSATGAGMAKAAAGVAAGVAAYYALNNLIGGNIEPLKGLGLGDIRATFERNKRSLETASATSQAGKSEQAEAGLQQAPTVQAINQQTGVLQKIERNTERQVELQKMLLGGGELARALIASRAFWSSRSPRQTAWVPTGGPS